MTHKEFCSWLQGYLQGGGSDMQVIKAKLHGLMTDAVFIPAVSPSPFITDQFPPYPPQPMRTGDPPYGPPWEVTCGDIIGPNGNDSYSQ